MTILERLRRRHEVRIAKLKHLKAPKTIIENEEKLLKQVATIFGASEYGQLEVLSERQMYGARCGTYYLFDTAEGVISYFPRWGGRLKPFQMMIKPKAVA